MTPTDQTPTSAAPQTSLDVVRKVYELLSAGGAAEAGAAMAHPDITVYQSEELPWGGRYVGWEGFQQFAAALGDAVDSRIDIEHLYQAGDRVVQTGRACGVVRATGKPFEAREVHVWQVRDGLISSLDMYVETHVLLEALRAD
ncbi:nuclear transport factor 2 family protein [Catellatospora methionotrophica]|uniref:nuclear transport factor 2 family protein n=1 Tax=Catellatospora methionotrophica TaxID=121620 RepID=UPI0033C4EDDF